MVANADVEAEKMRKVPGIVFVDGPAGRRAHVAGAHIDVYEVIRAYRQANGDVSHVANWYHWLSPEQLDVAYSYYREFSEEIDTWLDEEAAMTLDSLHALVAARYGSRTIK